MAVYPINNITNKEIIYLTATIEGQFDDKWNCYKCINSGYREDNNGNQVLLDKYENTLRAIKLKKGCETRGHMFKTVNGIKFNTCLGNYNTVHTQHYIDMYQQYEKGNLPYPGSLSEQPAKIIDVFHTIGQLVADKVDEESKKTERDMALKNRKKR